MSVNFINISLLLLSLVLFSVSYTISIQPMKRLKNRGDNVWKESEILRSISAVFEIIIIFNVILWIWFPLPLVNWKIDPHYLISLIIAIVIIIPSGIIMIKGIKDGGSETLKTSKDNEMYGGIYKYIRHPQSLGEFPSFIALGFLVNSWFLVVLFAIYVMIYVPIMIYFEEKDLIRRFGEDYKVYRKKTGIFLPKFRK